MFLGRPNSETSVGNAAWVLFESGDIVLRRSRHEAEVEQAACFHLRALEAAVTSALLPLRLRTVVLPDGDVVLAEPGPLHDLAGHDRRLARRGCVVLPTTVVLIDPDEGQLLLPEQVIDASIPTGRRRIRSILLRNGEDDVLPAAASRLAVARTVVRDPNRDLDTTLRQIDTLARHHGERIELVTPEAMIQRVHGLGFAPAR